MLLGGMDWQKAYQEDRTPWDLRGVTGPLRRLVETGGLTRLGLPERAATAVPGCGRGHDLQVFAGLGYEVTGFDISSAAVREAEQLLRLNRVSAQVLIRDVFGLIPEFEETFDLVYDYTSFAAVPPHLRRSYAEQMAGILRGGGLMLLLAFPMREEAAGGPGRPPFLMREQDVAGAMGPFFETVEKFAAQDSPLERRGAESWFVFRKTE